MSTEKDYSQMANDVYKVDAGKVSNPRRKGDKVADDKYVILQVEDNHKNGMQAMAVASLDKNGNGTAIYAIL